MGFSCLCTQEIKSCISFTSVPKIREKKQTWVFFYCLLVCSFVFVIFYFNLSLLFCFFVIFRSSLVFISIILVKLFRSLECLHDMLFCNCLSHKVSTKARPIYFKIFNVFIGRGWRTCKHLFISKGWGVCLLVSLIYFKRNVRDDNVVSMSALNMSPYMLMSLSRPSK